MLEFFKPVDQKNESMISGNDGSFNYSLQDYSDIV